MVCFAEFGLKRSLVRKLFFPILLWFSFCLLSEDRAAFLSWFPAKNFLRTMLSSCVKFFQGNFPFFPIFSQVRFSFFSGRKNNA